MSYRNKQMDKLMAELVGEILEKEVDFPDGVLVTVSGVETSSDLLYSKLYISVFPSQKATEALKKIEKEIYWIQQEINKKLAIRPVPKLVFKIDDSEEKTAEIEKLIAFAKERDAEAIKKEKSAW